ncbi:sulfotransferase family 2 domain-containing protein [Ketobacter sp.]|uniref:sulfotransferase family 2 domain-containing protein n=1 Tax=Ketobacter sp. TaxID=2083498 RepID=UPI000F1167D6|nr:sulfotransferase family 2 domain-containing protein [Ketobacter sp.]RLU01159.1 MAG: hypothetical protein D9N14_04235 [Ketobacter sp.]
MISHELKCIFIHIPKCAGTSIESALGHLDGHNGRGGQDHRSMRMIQQPAVSTDTFTRRDNIMELYRRIKHHLSPNVTNPNNKITLTRQQYLSYFKFTIVRDPWDRAYSWYNNYVRDPEHEKSGLSRRVDFNQFLQQESGHGMLASQLYWLQDSKGNIPMDYIGRFENLAADFSYVCEQLGVADQALPHKVKGEANGYRDRYDEEARALVESVYREEIDLFGYQF